MRSHLASAVSAMFTLSLGCSGSPLPAVPVGGEPNEHSDPNLPVRGIDIGDFGGGDLPVIHLPFASDRPIHCVQGVRGSYSHDGTSTRYDLDLDTPNDRDEMIFAPVSGEVFVHRDPNDPFGIHMNISIGQNLYVTVCHFKEILLKDQDEIAAGQPIGIEGCTGSCTGDHVHIGFHRGDPTVSAKYGESVPGAFLAREEGVYFSPKNVEDFDCSLSSPVRYYSANLITLSHPNGTLVKRYGDPKVYRRDNLALRWITNEDTFHSYGYDFNKVITISDQEFNCHRMGEPISGGGKVEAVYDTRGQLWLIVGSRDRGDRYRIRVGGSAWQNLLSSWGLEGYDGRERPGMVQDNHSLLMDWPVRDGHAKFRDGSLVSEMLDPKIYVITDGMAFHIKNMETFRLLGYDLRHVIQLPVGSLEEIQGTVGDCQAGVACLDETFATTCGGTLSVGGEFSDRLGEEEDQPVENNPPETNPDPPGQEEVDDRNQVDPEETEPPAEVQERELTLSWRMPFGEVARSIVLSGEYIFADGSFGFAWGERARVQNANSITYSLEGVSSGDHFRFSVEFEDSQGNISWSCLGPYVSGTDQSGTLQGQANAQVDGADLSISVADDPTSLGCDLALMIP